MGYFIVLVVEIVSIRTLQPGFICKGKKEEKGDIVDLLNSYASKFLRVEHLNKLWEKTLDRYVPVPADIERRREMGFDRPKRRFNLSEIDEATRQKIAVAMLLGMHELPDVEKGAIMEGGKEETKEAIAACLKDKVLMLPEELRCQFDAREYYPKLYEKAINMLMKRVGAFFSSSDQTEIFDRLKRRGG
jgi:hypothetical protein